ncbi:MAG: L-2-hydroxyglutarate oxidase [Mycobacteriales bacterium]
MGETPRYAVVGGGIVGLAVAARIADQFPRAAVTVLEKESRWAAHQTGRNSGVIHSGVYYRPGSNKARMCRRGAMSMYEFARQENIPAERVGKLIVATSPAELPRLTALRERGVANGLDVRVLQPGQAREIEPYVDCVAALHVPETGIIDFAAVCAALARQLERGGAQLRLSTKVTGVRHSPRATVLETTRGEVEIDLLVNCAGLQSDQVAEMTGRRPSTRVVPFRGEYYELRPDRRHLVRALVYPVPDPVLPFLGVHLTRGIGGRVLAGPNAVLALAREGYDWRSVQPRELAETLRFPGFWRLARRHARTGLAETIRSLYRHGFAQSLRRLVPDVRDDDLLPAPAGVRAQAVAPNGMLLDDFVIDREARAVHVLNAPSPAATSAFEIAKHVVSLLA